MKTNVAMILKVVDWVKYLPWLCKYTQFTTRQNRSIIAMVKFKRCKVCSSRLRGFQTSFCSNKCRNLGHRKREKKSCEVCGESFEVGGRAAPYSARFCSNVCRGISQRKGKRRDWNVCLACGKEYPIGDFWPAKSRDSKFCSMNCQQLARYRKSSKKCKKLSVAEASYIAGIIDGEGSIMLVGRNKQGKNPSVALRISVSNSNFDLFNWLIETTKIGRTYIHPTKSSKPIGSWRVHGEGAERLLRQVRPFMIIKARHAKLAVRFQRRLRIPKFKANRKWQLKWQRIMKRINSRKPMSENSIRRLPGSLINQHDKETKSNG